MLTTRLSIINNDIIPLDAALAYAARGWQAFPLQTVINGACTCARGAECGNPGKHPRVAGGVHSATTDEATIRAWWEQWPAANVGIATGAASGLVVLDVDPRHGGDTSLAILESQVGALPRTLVVRTGSGGLHIYFKAPSRPVRNSASKLGAGLDIRAEGGYVVAPPSRHQAGGVYEWLS